MTERDDQRLKERFEALRAETRGAGAVPDFTAMMAEAKRQAEASPALEVVQGGRSWAGRPQGRRRFMRVGAWASVAAAAMVTGLLLVGRAPSADAEFERLVTAYSSEVRAGWRSPTSGLLDVPGMDLMRSVPSIGAPVRGIDPSRLLVPESSLEEDTL